MKKNSPWCDENDIKMFSNITVADMNFVCNTLDELQLPIAIINPLFAFKNRWKVALFTSSNLDITDSDLTWDERLLNLLQKQFFANTECYWTCLSNTKDLVKNTYTFKEKFHPAGLFKQKLTLKNYRRFKATLPPIYTETVLCFDANRNFAFLQVAQEYILLAVKEELIQHDLAEIFNIGWSELNSESDISGFLLDTVLFSQKMYKYYNLIA